MFSSGYWCGIMLTTPVSAAYLRDEGVLLDREWLYMVLNFSNWTSTLVFAEYLTRDLTSITIVRLVVLSTDRT